MTQVSDMKYSVETTMDLKAGFAVAVEKKAGTNIGLCYQCLSCTSGCPAVLEMDFLPHQLVRMVKVGMKDTVLKSRTIWVCTDCKACSTRCPNGIDIPALMDTLREMAISESPERNVTSFHKLFIDNVRLWGRQDELSLILRHKMATRDFFSDLNSGIKMLLKGKLRLLPAKLKDIENVKEIYRRAGTDVR
jgi:heterodisulfide reductase subunit C